MTEDVTTSLKQVMDGIGDSLGINPSVLLSSFAGTKLAGLTDGAKADGEAAAGIEKNDKSPKSTSGDDSEEDV